jgi:hypothetical protein
MHMNYKLYSLIYSYKNPHFVCVLTYFSIEISNIFDYNNYSIPDESDEEMSNSSLIGKWNLESSENMNEFLKQLGKYFDISRFERI